MARSGSRDVQQAPDFYPLGIQTGIGGLQRAELDLVEAGDRSQRFAGFHRVRPPPGSRARGGPSLFRGQDRHRAARAARLPAGNRRAVRRRRGNGAWHFARGGGRAAGQAGTTHPGGAGGELGAQGLDLLAQRLVLFAQLHGFPERRWIDDRERVGLDQFLSAGRDTLEKVVFERALEAFNRAVVVKGAQLLLAGLEMRVLLLVHLAFSGRRTARQPKAKEQHQRITPAERHGWNLNERAVRRNEDEFWIADCGLRTADWSLVTDS